MPKKNMSILDKAKRLSTPILVLLSFSLGALLFGGGGDVEPEVSKKSTHTEHSNDEAWTCSMHPQIRSDHSGACPICGMDLIPIKNHQTSKDSPPQRIALSESAKIRAQIRTSPVKFLHQGGEQRRLLGRVDYDETRLRTLTSWISGRIDRLHIRTTGQRVKRGQVIATLYSPEIFSAHKDLLVAQKQLQKLEGATEQAKMGAQLALKASQDRLRLLGMAASVIKTMEKAKRPSEQVAIRSPFSGTVIERLATEGSYVKTGTGLLQLADLTRLWVQLDAYESDLALLRVGQKVSLKVEALPSENFSGRVKFVDPVINQRTRTTRVRIEVQNIDGKLRPNMFAEAIVQSHQGEVHQETLIIPDTAPLFTGRRSLVYVEVPNTESPTYDARLVKLGHKMGKVYPVIAGLQVGERVVTNGAFTLDADLQIRGGHSMMAAPDDSSQGPFDNIVAIPKNHKESLTNIISSYLSLHEALASDDFEAAQKANSNLGSLSEAFNPPSPPTVFEAWSPIRRQLLEHSKQVSKTTNLNDARVPFRNISQQIATILRIFGNPSKDTVRLAFCPMALEGEGAEWVQRASKIENPYFGSKMHNCGDIHESVTHGTYLPAKRVDPPQPTNAAGHQH